MHRDATLSDVEGLLLYDVDVYHAKRKLHVISDPCALKYHQSIGSGLWQSSLELLDFFKGLPSTAVKGLHILELGSGLGVVGQVRQMQRSSGLPH